MKTTDIVTLEDGNGLLIELRLFQADLAELV